MTTPTHIAGATAGMLLIAVAFRCLNVSWATILFTMFAGLLPDIDNVKSIIGWLFHRLVSILSFGKVNFSKLVQHRGFFHSLPFVALLSFILYFIRADLIPYLLIGMLSHIVLDSFQKRGVKLLGFGNAWGRFSLNWNMLLRSSGEYSVLASCIMIILVSSAVISKGGTNHIIRKALGTLKATVEDINDLKNYECFLVVNDSGVQREYLIIGSFGKDSVIVLDGNSPLSFGYRHNCQLKADNKSYVRKGRNMKTIEYKFILKDKSLRHLYNKIDSSYFYYFSGSALLKDSKEIPFFYNRYNTVSASGKRLNFEFARLEDLKVYGIEDSEILLGDFVITYRIAEGQNPPPLSAKITEAVSADVEAVEKRISELKGIINSPDLKREVENIFNVDSEEAEIYLRVFRKKAEELLKEEEAGLLRIRSIKKDTP